MAIQLQTNNVNLDSKTNLPKQGGFQIRTEDIEGLPTIKRNTNFYDSINFTNIYYYFTDFNQIGYSVPNIILTSKMA